MSTTTATNTGRVTINMPRIDALKEKFMSTPADISSERNILMMSAYEETAGYQQIIRRAKFLAYVLDNKELYIDENLFVGSMASSTNATYPYPEWNVEWMKEENTVERSKTPEDRKANQWALDYWDKRSLKPRSDEIFIRKYGFDPNPCFKAGLIAEFTSWPGGGGNLNYPKVYNEGLASMIEDVEERQMALDMLLPNASKFYFYESSLIVMRGFIRFANRYAALAREMAAKEEDETRKAELIAIAETCEWVPEHPARNLREAIQCHFFCHICAELEQVGCGYSEAYLGQNLEPYYQADKAAGLVGPDEATFMLENLFIKLNEIGYYFGEKVALQNSADLGQSISLGGFTEDGEDATAEMDFLVLDAANYLHLPQPPLSCVYTERMSGKFLEKVLDVIGTGIGMPQFVNGDVMMKRALHMFADSKKGITLEKARRTCIGACVGSYIPYETGHPVEGQPNLGKVIELTMNNGFDPRTKQQVGPKTGDPESFKTFEELYAAFQKQINFNEEVLRRGAWIASMLCADFLPVTWRSLLTGGCIETGTEVWNGGANYYTCAQIVVGGIDAANCLMAVKKLVYDDKKITMAELKKALAANFEGEYKKVRKLCYEAPKHGNDIPEMNRMAHRVYESIITAFNNVDGGGNYLSKDIKSAPDAYTKSVHNLMGMVTGALPNGKYAGVALTDGSLSAMPGTDV
ncbi:MAG: hypothetical protein MUP44_03635, partial [Anaerolineales bacterium]|nr:hypothetical protein [Anaerolineales bacterium]